MLNRKIWLVTQHEYLYNVRRPGFLFGTFGAPLITIVLLIIVFALTTNSETGMGQIEMLGYVDHAGVLSQAIEKPDNYIAYATEDEARQAYDDKTIGAYFVISADYMTSGTITLYSATNVSAGLKASAEDFLIANLGASLNNPPLVERIKNPVDMSILTLNNGRLIESSGLIALFIMPMIFVMVFMMASQITSSYLMSGVVEEKSSRVIEMLITSITPGQLLIGKIIGLGLLGLTQLAIWMVAGSVGLKLGQNTAALAGVTLPVDLLLVTLVYFILNYFLLASLMAGIGAITGAEQESRQLAGIFTLIIVIPFFFIASFINDPNGAVPLILSLIPFTAPISVILRMSFGTIPAWQLGLSLVILLVSTIIVTWGSGRVFRWALLMYGKRPTPLELFRVIRGKSASKMGTVASVQEGR